MYVAYDARFKDSNVSRLLAKLSGSDEEPAAEAELPKPDAKAQAKADTKEPGEWSSLSLCWWWGRGARFSLLETPRRVVVFTRERERGGKRKRTKSVYETAPNRAQASSP